MNATEDIKTQPTKPIEPLPPDQPVVVATSTNKPKNLVIVGSVLLMVGAVMPWATVTSNFLGISKSVYGYESTGIFTGLAGIIFLIIALNSKPQPGKQFSAFITITCIIIGLMTAFKVFNIILLPSTEGIQTSIGFGLSCLSPLGILLAFSGGSIRSEYLSLNNQE